MRTANAIRYGRSDDELHAAPTTGFAGSPNGRYRNPPVLDRAARRCAPPQWHASCCSQRWGDKAVLREIPVIRECFRCGRVEFSAAVSVIVVWAHGLTVAVPMIPKDELRVCGSGKCDAARRLISRAFEVHPETQMAVGFWRRALIVFEDGNGVGIRNKGAEKLALA